MASGVQGLLFDQKSMGPARIRPRRRTDAQQLVALYAELFAGRFGMQPMILARDYAVMAKLVQQRPVEEIERLLRRFIRDGTRWARRTVSWNLRTFRGEYHRLLVIDKEDVFGV